MRRALGEEAFAAAIAAGRALPLDRAIAEGLGVAEDLVYRSPRDGVERQDR